MSIEENLLHIRELIAAAARRAGRDPETVRLVAVSKTKPASAVDEAARAGQRLFGENYVQEFTVKAKEVSAPVEWHFIGALQSNKVRQIAGLVTLIHSVDRLSLVQEIERQWAKLDATCDVLIQVNIAGEATKSGTTAADLITLVKEVATLPHLRVRGLMTMPPFFDDPDGARPYFRELKRLAGVVAAEGIPRVAMEELSMGMSGDFEAAVEEGATLVRIGTSLFGVRHYHR